MKKVAKVAALALVVLTLFVSCYECDVCGKFRPCKTYDIWGIKVHVCPECDS